MSFDHTNLYFQDCVHIRSLAKELGYHISLEEACAIWEFHSEAYAATWLVLEDDQSIKNTIEFYMPIHSKVCPHCGQKLEKSKDE